MWQKKFVENHNFILAFKSLVKEIPEGGDKKTEIVL